MTGRATWADVIAKREALLDVIRSILVADLQVRLEPDAIDPDLPLFGTGLGLDSVDAVDLVTRVEQRTGVRIPQDERGRIALRSVNSLVDLLIAEEG